MPFLASLPWLLSSSGWAHRTLKCRKGEIQSSVSYVGEDKIDEIVEQRAREKLEGHLMASLAICRDELIHFSLGRRAELGENRGR